MRVLFLVIALVTVAGEATAEIGFTQDAQHRTTSLSGLTAADEACSRHQIQGVVVNRRFDADGTTLDGFVIQHRDGTRDYVDVFVGDELGMAMQGIVSDGLQRLTRVGRSMLGHALACGVGRRVETLQDIR